MNHFILALATVFTLPGCGGSSAANSAVEITAAWEGGAQGPPTTTKASTPTTWSGNLCPAASISFTYQAHVNGPNNPGGIIIMNHCTESVVLYVCAPSGAPTGSLRNCAVSPLETPLSAFSGNGEIPDGVDGPNSGGTYLAMPASSSIVAFYCSDASNFVASPLVSSIGCN
jgi:hypothetical protein